MSTIKINEIEVAVPAEYVAYKYADEAGGARWITTTYEACQIARKNPDSIVWATRPGEEWNHFRPGDRVRCVGEPWTGVLVKITSLLPLPDQLAVRLDSGGALVSAPMDKWEKTT